MCFYLHCYTLYLGWLLPVSGAYFCTDQWQCDNLHTGCSLQGFTDILTLRYRLEKLDKLQMAAAWKIIAQFLLNLQCLLLIPIVVSIITF